MERVMRHVLPLLASLTACAPEAALPVAPVTEAPAPRSKRPSHTVPLRLIGQDPAWIGRVASDGISIGGAAPGRVRVPWFDPVIGDDGVHWRTTSSQGPLEILLVPAACSDGTGQRYTFAATVVLGARTLRGCAAPEADFTWVE